MCLCARRATSPQSLSLLVRRVTSVFAVLLPFRFDPPVFFFRIQNAAALRGVLNLDSENGNFSAGHFVSF